MNPFCRLKLWRRFAVLIALFSLAFLVSGAWSFKTLNELTLAGPTVSRLIDVNQFVADVDTASRQLGDSLVAALSLRHATDAAQQARLTDNLLNLRRKYEVRIRKVLERSHQTEQEVSALRAAHAAALDFYRIAFDDYLPAIRNGDGAAAAHAMTGLLHLAEAEQAASGRAVELALMTDAAFIASLREQVTWDMLLLWGIFVLSLGIGLKVAAMIRDSIAYPLIEAGNIAKRIAAGDFSARADQAGDHEIAVLALAMNQMAESLAQSDASLRAHAVALEHQATHDDLTGLPNRALFKDRLQQSLRYAQRHRQRLMLIFIDLDNFKLVNDSLGHNMGDELLKTVAQRMTQCVRGSDTVVRLGGDEFVILLLDQQDKAETITGFLQKLKDTIARPLQIGKHQLQVSCSMGLAAYPDDGEDVETLLRNADAAMYRAKELGRGNFQFYTAELNARVHERLVLEEGLRNAIANEEFRLLFQPQIDIRSGAILGVEALIRWQHPRLGMVPPDKFIGLAEDTGLIVPIGAWVLRTACLQNRQWQDAGLPPVVMSVNVSARQLREKDWLATVENALGESGLAASHLELEVTESAIMQDLSQAVTTMNRLKAMGVRLSIDDFGTGYSSLSSLKSFPVARLKIDRSFMRDIPADKDGEAIAMAVIALGHRLDLRVIAEGVETLEQLEFLQAHSCDELQGYYFSRPVTADQIAVLLAGHQPQPVDMPRDTD